MFYDPDSYIVEEIIPEEITITEDGGFSNEQLTHRVQPTTKLIIDAFYDGDFEKAVHAANHIIKTERFIPSWVRELVGPRQGWKDFSRGGHI